MIKTETNSSDKIFRISNLAESDVSSVGTYAQYAVFYSTNIPKTAGKVIEIFLLDTREDWSIERITENSHLGDSVINDQGINGWIGWIKEGFYKFKEVESVYYTVDNNTIDVWIIIPDKDFSLLRQLIEVEMNVLDKFEADNGSLYIFEFHIIYRCGVNEASLIPYGAVRLLK